MSAFLLLMKIRLLEVWRKPFTGFLYLALPVVLLLITLVVFWNGHPFERRQVALLGEIPPATIASLEGFPDISLIRGVTQEEVAKEQLSSRAVSAVLVWGEPPRLLVSSRDEIFGRGLSSVLPGAKLVLIETSRFGYVRYLFPGFLALSVMFSGLLGMGHSLVKYRQSLFLKKLATTPLSRATFILSQLMSRTLLVLAQSLLLLLVAWVLLDLSLPPLRLSVALIGIFLGLLAFTGLGFLLACLIKTEEIFLDVLNMIVSPSIFFSEIFFPASVLPSPLPLLAEALPSTHLVRLLRASLLYGDLSSLWVSALWIVGWALIAYLVSSWRFRWYD